jgi:hypothetical protein
MKSLSNQKLVFSALCIALYIVVMMCTQSFAFGQYQIRIATALYGLSAIFPFLVLPFGLANVVSNTVMRGGLSIDPYANYGKPENIHHRIGSTLSHTGTQSPGGAIAWFFVKPDKSIV